MTDRLADTRVPIHEPIAARWSPRAFDPDATVSIEQLTAVLEAARWSATWGQRQPVRFIVGLRGDETFGTLAATLKRGNAYAHAAGALILVCADEGSDEKTALYSCVDAGAAIANASIEAVVRGLVAHPMAGFDTDAARTAFDVPEHVRPLAVLAIGTLGDYATADEAIVDRDSRPRERMPLDQVAFSGRWGSAFTPGTSSPAV
ncbi:nitroreductase family protein [Mycolicibacterium hodleri]|uniref:Nitroreductase n=1 Tax=Mycolicibacterium hodleri TaxID=49897 RepID=A0A502DYX8_9MYCO|nr:nitroreductase family protein [Mycolicibacterium hodleri]TPG29491.1 nitroreductase [Mycolicibacterium hodleri]